MTIDATLARALAAGAHRLPALAQDCPSRRCAARDYKPPEATRVYARDGSLLADLSPERRVVVDLDEVPPTVSNGFVAVEDRRFWHTAAWTVRGIGRAAWRNLISLSLAEGFSTITMQLPRNVFPDELPRSDRMRRKICEVRLAGQHRGCVQRSATSSRMYINQVYIGDGRYGIEEAARGYFGKPARRLTLRRPHSSSGWSRTRKATIRAGTPTARSSRRNVVLDVHGPREGDRRRQRREGPGGTASRSRRRPRQPVPAPYYVAAVRRELRERFGDDAAVQGLRVHTGLDPALQKAAREALVAQIWNASRRALRPLAHPKPEPGTRPMPAQGSGSPYLQGMVIVLDAHTGEVRALVGGRDFTHSSFDRAFTRGGSPARRSSRSCMRRRSSTGSRPHRASIPHRSRWLGRAHGDPTTSCPTVVHLTVAPRRARAFIQQRGRPRRRVGRHQPRRGHGPHSRHDHARPAVPLHPTSALRKSSPPSSPPRTRRSATAGSP
jgi:membrane carboxypeptidase/penicillin-binding protein